MQIIIVEKDANGRNLLNRTLTMEGYDVSIADSGSQVIDLLREVNTNVVFMNIFRCLLALPKTAEPLLVVRQFEALKPVLLVTCNMENAAPECCDTNFDLLPTKVKSRVMNSIQGMCAALRHGRSPFDNGEAFNRQRFGKLIDMPTDFLLPAAARPVPMPVFW